MVNICHNTLKLLRETQKELLLSYDTNPIKNFYTSIDINSLLSPPEIKHMLLKTIKWKIKHILFDNSDITISQDDNTYEYLINNEVISNQTMNDIGWTIKNKEEFINHLFNIEIPLTINQDREEDLWLIKPMLKDLFNSSDKYILHSIETNEIIFQSNLEQATLFQLITQLLLTKQRKLFLEDLSKK